MGMSASPHWNRQLIDDGIFHPKKIEGSNPRFLDHFYWLSSGIRCKRTSPRWSGRLWRHLTRVSFSLVDIILHTQVLNPGLFAWEVRVTTTLSSPSGLIRIAESDLFKCRPQRHPAVPSSFKTRRDYCSRIPPSKSDLFSRVLGYYPSSLFCV